MTDYEREQAIKEAHNNAASAAYFEVRAKAAYPQPHTIFDAAFSRGWDAGRVPLLERIAALEAKLAQRVPDGYADLLKADQEVLSWTQAADRPPVRDVLECGRGAMVRVHALADLHDAVKALSAVPAAPEQQEPTKECWCEACDLAQGNPMGRTRMSACPQCGDKRCPRAKHHDSACQVAPAPNAQQAEAQEPFAWAAVPNALSHPSMDRFLDFDEPNQRIDWTVVPLFTCPQPAQLSDAQREVIAFLDGTGPLDGVWWGDKHPTEQGAFWWRKRLWSAFGSAIAAKNGVWLV